VLRAPADLHDGGGHGFRHDIDRARTGTLGGFFDGSAFDLG